MESKRLSKLSYALSYEINMINHIIKAMFIYSCEFEIIKNRNMKLNMNDKTEIMVSYDKKIQF